MSTPPTDDSDLRSLFDDAVSDVYPEPGRARSVPVPDARPRAAGCP